VEFTLGELAERVGARVLGDDACVISGVASLKNAQPGDISFLANSRYRKYLRNSEASAVILGVSDQDGCEINRLIVDDPYLCYARVATLLHPPRQRTVDRHPTAVISAESDVHPSASVGPNCVIEAGVSIGENSEIAAGCYVGEGAVIGCDSCVSVNVSICNGSRIGDRTLIHPGVVIGGDGFGLASNQGRWFKVPQLGRVVIGSDVEIGANTTIDRGALEDTVLEDGVKLDNQIQVAHNVHIGAHTAIAGCTGIAGSVRIGRHCAIGGGVGILGHLEIVDRVHITAMSLVTKSIEKPGVYSSGTPLEENRSWRKNYARIRQLDSIARRLKCLETELLGGDSKELS